MIDSDESHVDVADLDLVYLITPQICAAARCRPRRVGLGGLDRRCLLGRRLRQGAAGRGPSRITAGHPRDQGPEGGYPSHLKEHPDPAGSGCSEVDDVDELAIVRELKPGQRDERSGSSRGRRRSHRLPMPASPRQRSWAWRTRSPYLRADCVGDIEDQTGQLPLVLAADLDGEVSRDSDDGLLRGPPTNFPGLNGHRRRLRKTVGRLQPLGIGRGQTVCTAP